MLPEFRAFVGEKRKFEITFERILTSVNRLQGGNGNDNDEGW